MRASAGGRVPASASPLLAPRSTPVYTEGVRREGDRRMTAVMTAATVTAAAKAQTAKRPTCSRYCATSGCSHINHRQLFKYRPGRKETR